MPTLAELREYARWRLDQHADNYLETEDSTRFDLDKALLRGYEKYAMAVKAFPVEYERAAVAGVGTYALGAFGAQSANTTAVSSNARADNTTPFVLIGGAAPTYPSRITVSIVNGGNAPATGNSTTITVAGYGRGYMPITEALSWVQATDLTAVASSGIVTKTTVKRFLLVSSITVSAAQPAQSLPGVDWYHTAGLPAVNHGERIFEVGAMEYADVRLERRDVAYLDKYLSTWRSADGGTPGVWIPDGAGAIRLWRTPTGTDTIRIAGWETPEQETFEDDASVPDCPVEDAYLIPLWACILFTSKSVTETNAARQSAFYPEWHDGITKAHKRIYGAGYDPILGRYGEAETGVGPWYDPNVVNI